MDSQITKQNIIEFVSDNEIVANKIFSSINIVKIRNAINMSLIFSCINGTYREQMVNMLNLIDDNEVLMLSIIFGFILKQHNYLVSLYLSLF